MSEHAIEKHTDRPTFHEVYMSLANAMAARSTCARLKVGCVITSTDFRKVLAVGYNGNASGLANKCDSVGPDKCGCLHAEENAVINCDVSRDVDKIVFCTNLPCKMCAKRLINLGGVVKIYYNEDYRLRDGVDILKEVGIYIARYSFRDEVPPATVVAATRDDAEHLQDVAARWRDGKRVEDDERQEVLDMLEAATIHAPGEVMPVAKVRALVDAGHGCRDLRDIRDALPPELKGGE